MVYYLTPFIPLSLKGEGEGEILKKLCSTVFTKMSKLHTLGLETGSKRR